MVGHCQQQAGYRHPMPLLHQQPSVPTQLPVDYGPSCGSLLGHSQEWADSRPGHSLQFHPHWFCPACGHSWQAKIYVKVDGQSGCPKCSTINRPWSRQSSLTQSQHTAMLEFDFERNRLILTRSRQEATRWCTGSVPKAPTASHTCLWQVPKAALASIGVAPIVPARRLASATHCSRCTLR